jgi:hypothetical protein
MTPQQITSARIAYARHRGLWHLYGLVQGCGDFATVSAPTLDECLTLAMGRAYPILPHQIWRDREIDMAP